MRTAHPGANNVCGPSAPFSIATPNYKILEHFNHFADAWRTSVDSAAR
jgi:hypothetical protein